MKRNFASSCRIAAAFSLLTLPFSGCHGIGPSAMSRDRFDYSSAIADSWKQQMLLNVVKIRYMDLPVFVDVASVVAGYSLQTGVSVSGTVSSDNAVQGNFGAVGGQAVYTDRPTITYTPMTGQKFLRGLVTPIEPKNIFFLVQSGYPADFILGLTVESLNGVRNRSTSGGQVRLADPNFTRALELLREVQVEGAMGMRVEEDKAKHSTAVLFFRRQNLSPELASQCAEIRKLLNLPSEPDKFTLTYSPMPGAAGELAVNSRSMLQIIQAFSSYVQVPPDDLKTNRAMPAFESEAGQEGAPRARIYSGREKPVDAFAAVYYRGHWFWIDQSDWRAKRAMTAIMFFFTLADTGGNDNLPLITIPAQ